MSTVPSVLLRMSPLPHERHVETERASHEIPEALSGSRGQLHPEIVYPLVLVKGAPSAARDLWEWLQTEPARGAFRSAGFSVPR